MNRTSPSSRLVSKAATSPDLAITGPEVARNPTPISRATICARVVLPRPGGPKNRTWSSASPRALAASMNTLRFSRAAFCPTNSSSVFGRNAESRSSGRRSGMVMRSGSVIAPLDDIEPGSATGAFALGPDAPLREPGAAGPRIMIAHPLAAARTDDQIEAELLQDRRRGGEEQGVEGIEAGRQYEDDGGDRRG